MTVPQNRIRTLNSKPTNQDGDYVLYWMTANRRPQYNFALERAVEIANEAKKPLLVFEPLRLGYRWACDRFHQFIIQGMEANQEFFARRKISYLPFVERKKGDGSGLLEYLAEKSVAVVADDYPVFFLPALLRRFANAIDCALESVDSNGIYPMREAPKVFSRAHFFRIFLQKNLREHLLDFPENDPLDRLKNKTSFKLENLPKRWQRSFQLDVNLSRLDIDHSVEPIDSCGGYAVAETQLREFIENRIATYDDKRNYPEQTATSRLSGHLHFGHLSAHQVFSEIAEAESWSPDQLADEPTKKAEGWWGMSPSAEAFIDQLVTWRELGFNMAWQDRSYDKYRSLPDWVRKTLDEHRDDKRDPCYDLEQFENASTHDPLWNAAQNQLRQEGIIHNYLRMLWGKKILHWSESPEEALRIMIELNNKYAIDGRDPNSYSGIFWVMGRYDRAWGPERPIFGKIRYMASENTARKFPVKDYVKRYAEP